MKGNVIKIKLPGKTFVYYPSTEYSISQLSKSHFTSMSSFYRLVWCYPVYNKENTPPPAFMEKSKFQQYAPSTGFTPNFQY